MYLQRKTFTIRMLFVPIEEAAVKISCQKVTAEHMKCVAKEMVIDSKIYVLRNWCDLRFAIQFQKRIPQFN